MSHEWITASALAEGRATLRALGKRADLPPRRNDAALVEARVRESRAAITTSRLFACGGAIVFFAALVMTGLPEREQWMVAAAACALGGTFMWPVSILQLRLRRAAPVTRRLALVVERSRQRRCSQTGRLWRVVLEFASGDRRVAALPDPEGAAVEAGDFAETAEHTGDVIRADPVASLDPVRNRQAARMEARIG